MLDFPVNPVIEAWRKMAPSEVRPSRGHPGSWGFGVVMDLTGTWMGPCWASDFQLVPTPKQKPIYSGGGGSKKTHSLESPKKKRVKINIFQFHGEFFGSVAVAFAHQLPPFFTACFGIWPWDLYNNSGAGLVMFPPRTFNVPSAPENETVVGPRCLDGKDKTDKTGTPESREMY